MKCNCHPEATGAVSVLKVIVRFNRSGNRSNDSAERTIGVCALSEVVRNVGGEGTSSSLRSRSEGSRVIVRFNRSVVFTERMVCRRK